MSYAPIVVILQKSGCEDDVLTLTPSPDASGFDVKFVQNTINLITRLYVEEDEITNYMYHFFQSLALDERGYEYVQIDCPGFPSVIKGVDTVQKYFSVLCGQIDSIFASWPEEEKLSDKKNRAARRVSYCDEPLEY
jgi:hypothetical protein